MRRLTFCFLVLTCMTGCLNSVVSAQEKPLANEAEAQGAAKPASGARAEFLDELSYFEQRFTLLAGAMPAEKYGWRPGEGVRSAGEVYAHVAAGNYRLPGMIGFQPPAGVDSRTIASTISDKAKVLQNLKDSFAYFRSVVASVSDADLDKPLKLFGRQTTYRGFMFFVAGHLGEHLGQSIAYARMNGVVPPWTEEQLRQAQQPKPAEKPKP